MEEAGEDSDKLIGAVAEIGVEHCPDDDVHGDAGHGRVQIDGGAGAPVLKFALDAVLHDLGVALDMAQVEGGLQRLTFAFPGRAVAGEDIFAQDVAKGSLDDGRLAEGFAARRQHFADVIGVVDEVAAHGSEANAPRGRLGGLRFR